MDDDFHVIVRRFKGNEFLNIFVGLIAPELRMNLDDLPPVLSSSEIIGIDNGTEFLGMVRIFGNDEHDRLHCVRTGFGDVFADGNLGTLVKISSKMELSDVGFYGIGIELLKVDVRFGPDPRILDVPITNGIAEVVGIYDACFFLRNALFSDFHGISGIRGGGKFQSHERFHAVKRGEGRFRVVMMGFVQ